MEGAKGSCLTRLVADAGRHGRVTGLASAANARIPVIYIYEQCLASCCSRGSRQPLNTGSLDQWAIWPPGSGSGLFVLET